MELNKFQAENRYSSFSLEMKFVKREDSFRPSTHLKLRPVMLPKSFTLDEMNDHSDEEYDVRDEESNPINLISHIARQA